MADQSWVDSLAIQESAGTSYASFTTSKSVIPPTALQTIRSNWFKTGKMLIFDVLGGITNIVTTPGTITFEVKIGSVVAFTTGAIQMNAAAHTNLPFWLRIWLTCRSIGSSTSATLMGQGVITSKTITRTGGTGDDANNDTTLMVPATAPAVGTGFDSTIDNILDFWAGFSISDPANAIKIEQYNVTRRN